LVFHPRGKHRLRVFVNKTERRIFGPKREEGAGDWRRLYNGELHNSYASPCTVHYQGDQIKKDEINGACSKHGSMINA
jgi:hypothetical protein